MVFDSYQWESGWQKLCKKTKSLQIKIKQTDPRIKRPKWFSHTLSVCFLQPGSKSLLLSLCWLPCASVCRTRPSSTSKRQARLRPKTSSRQQPSRHPPSRALPKLMAPPEPQGPPPAGVYNMVRTRGRPTRNLGLGPLGPPQAQGYYSQSTRLVGFLHQQLQGKCVLQNEVVGWWYLLYNLNR